MPFRGRLVSNWAVCPKLLSVGRHPLPPRATDKFGSVAKRHIGQPARAHTVVPEVVYGTYNKKRKMKTKCGRSSHLHPTGSTFEGSRAGHSDVIMGIWCWAQKLAPCQATAATGLNPNVVTDLYHALRLAATGVAMDLAEGETLGGGGKRVVIDEAYVSRRKYNKGRVTPTNTICIFGGVEIEEADGGREGEDGRPKYKETGMCFLVEIPDRAKETFQKEIKNRVAPGSRVD